MIQPVSMLAKCPRLPNTAYWASTTSELNHVQETLGQGLLETGQICATEYAKIFGNHRPVYAEFNTTYTDALVLSISFVSELPTISCK